MIRSLEEQGVELKLSGIDEISFYQLC